MSGDAPGSVCTTNDVKRRAVELQYALGEGRVWTPTNRAARCSNLIWPILELPGGWRSVGRPSRRGAGRCSDSRPGGCRPFGGA
jgi:hypothetical protein